MFYTQTNKPNTHTRDERLRVPHSAFSFFFFAIASDKEPPAQASVRLYRGLVHSGKTNLPVSFEKAESQKIAVWIWTALPCTTPRPALESSTNDLASDLWVLAQLCSYAYFSRVKKKEANRSMTGTPVADTQHSRRRTSPLKTAAREWSADQAFVRNETKRPEPPRWWSEF